MGNHPNRSAMAKRFQTLFCSLFPSLGETTRQIMWHDMLQLAPTNRAQLMDDLERAHANKEAMKP